MKRQFWIQISCRNVEVWTKESTRNELVKLHMREVCKEEPANLMGTLVQVGIRPCLCPKFLPHRQGRPSPVSADEILDEVFYCIRHVTVTGFLAL